MPIQQEVDRVLTLLRNKIRERGFTQLEVQTQLSWGRSYISQLFTRQKALRVEQVLAILKTIGVEPVDFYRELYQFPPLPSASRTYDEHAEPDQVPSAGSHEEMDGEDLGESFRQVRSMLRAVVQLLLDKEIFSVEEITTAVNGEMAEAVEPGADL